METSELREVISKNRDKLDPASIAATMDAYHRLEALGKPDLDELIDEYILGKLDPNGIKILEQHLESCESCRKNLELMKVFISGVKDLGDEILV
jgi:hypothetical protein